MSTITVMGKLSSFACLPNIKRVWSSIPCVIDPFIAAPQHQHLCDPLRNASVLTCLAL